MLLNGKRRWITILNWLLLLLPALLIIAIIIHGVFNVPFADSWDYIIRYRSMVEEGFDLNRILDFQINEHRVPTALAWMTFIWSVTKGNNTVVMVVAVLHMVGVLAITALYFKKQNLSLISLLPIAPILFSMRQGLLYLHTASLMWLIMLFSIFTSFYLLYQYTTKENKKERKYALFGSLIMAISTTFSAANGLMVWFVLLFVFLLRKLSEKEKLLTIDNAIVLLTGVICWMLYFYRWNGYHSTLYSANLRSVGGIFDFLHFFLTSLGNVIFTSGMEWMSFLCGSVLLSIFIVTLLYVFIKKKITETIFPLALCLFGLSSCAMVAYGRTNYPGGLSIAVDSHYSIMPMIFWCGLYIFEVQVWKIRRSNSVGCSGAQMVPVLLYFFLTMVSLGNYNVTKMWTDMLDACGYCTQHYDELPDTVRNNYVFPGDVTDHIHWMQDRGLFCFASDKRYEYPYQDYLLAERVQFTYPEEEALEAQYAIDYINDENPPGESIRINKSQGLRFVGWAIDPLSNRPQSSVYIELGGVYYLMQDWSRPDVGQSFDNEALNDSGFIGDFVTRNYTPGTYQANIIILFDNDTKYYSAPCATIVVEE